MSTLPRGFSRKDEGSGGLRARAPWLGRAAFGWGSGDCQDSKPSRGSGLGRGPMRSKPPVNAAASAVGRRLGKERPRPPTAA